MARPPHLALPVAVLAAAVILLRNLFAFDAFSAFDLTTLTLVSRGLWALVGAVGFASVGYAYGGRTTDGPHRTLAVAALAAFVGLLVGYLLVSFGTESVAGRLGPTVAAAQVGVYATLDALLFSFVVLGGYALAADPRA